MVIDRAWVVSYICSCWHQPRYHALFPRYFLKSRSRVNQGHWKWYHLIDWVWFGHVHASNRCKDENQSRSACILCSGTVHMEQSPTVSFCKVVFGKKLETAQVNVKNAKFTHLFKIGPIRLIDYELASKGTTVESSSSGVESKYIGTANWFLLFCTSDLKQNSCIKLAGFRAPRTGTVRGALLRLMLCVLRWSHEWITPKRQPFKGPRLPTTASRRIEPTYVQLDWWQWQSWGCYWSSRSLLADKVPFSGLARLRAC